MLLGTVYRFYPQFLYLVMNMAHNHNVHYVWYVFVIFVFLHATQNLHIYIYIYIYIYSVGSFPMWCRGSLYVFSSSFRCRQIAWNRDFLCPRWRYRYPLGGLSAPGGPFASIVYIRNYTCGCQSSQGGICATPNAMLSYLMCFIFTVTLVFSTSLANRPTKCMQSKGVLHVGSVIDLVS